MLSSFDRRSILKLMSAAAALPLVTLDTKLARLFSPIERIFGVTLLGTSSVNQIAGRGNGFNGNGN